MDKKKNPANKIEEEKKLGVYNLFLEGRTIAEACKEVGVNTKTASGWKKAKWPEDWDIAKARRLAAKTKLLEEEALEKVGSMNRRQQVRFQKVLDATANTITKRMERGIVKDRLAAEILFRGSEAERKLYVAPEVAFAPKPIGIQGGIGAFAKPTGEVGVLAVLNQMWEEGNVAKPADTNIVEQPSHPPDVRKIGQ